MRWVYAALLVVNTSCASMATGILADTLAQTGSTYASDDDPELIEAAVPFALKTMEGVLEAEPSHVGLLTALATGFTQYGYAFVGTRAGDLADTDVEGSQALSRRARRLYLRARGYAGRALDVRYPDFGAMLRTDPSGALERVRSEDAALLYWFAASWGLIVSSDKTDPDALADLPTVRLIADRLLEIDSSYGDGAVFELVGVLEAGSPVGSLDRAAEYFERAIHSAAGRRLGPYVAYAESVAVKRQDVGAFRRLLGTALQIPVDDFPATRLQNVMMRRRSQALLARIDDLFFDAEGDGF